jgi:hypothetical protein
MMQEVNPSALKKQMKGRKSIQFGFPMTYMFTSTSLSMAFTKGEKVRQKYTHTSCKLMLKPLNTNCLLSAFTLLVKCGTSHRTLVNIRLWS